MDREQALVDLTSSETAVRLSAARWLARHSTNDDLTALGVATAGEKDRWVRSALQQATSRARRRAGRTEATEAPEPSSELVADASEWLAAATETVAKEILHEVRPFVGRIKVALGRDLRRPRSGATWAEVERLERFLQGMEALSKPLGSARLEEVEIASLIEEAVLQVVADRSSVELVGPRPCLVLADRELLRLATTNGLRNAVEAVSHRDLEPGVVPITVGWGETDSEFWVTVKDAGAGLELSPSRLFGVGVSTKDKSTNLGMGLTIARHALASLGGEVTLAPRDPVGAEFRASWPRRSSRDDPDSNSRGRG